MREHFLVASIIIALWIVSYSHSRSLQEGFEDKKVEKFDLNKVKYGYVNTFYTALGKEPLELLKEPLPLQNVPECPSNTSEKTKKECKELFEFTNPKKIKSDIAESRKNFASYDEDPLKPFEDYCKKNKLEYKKKVIDKLIKDCAIIALKLKNIYNRPRPYQLCFIHGYPIKYLQSKHADTPSYPSSYALQSYVMGYILGNKFTKNQKDIEKIANDISWSRVYSGNNFTSDIECSKIIMYNLRNYLDTIEI